MRILAINGNPKLGGFITGALDLVASHLQTRGAEVERLDLAEADIQDCRACFTCLKTGQCVLSDDMPGIVGSMLAADGYVIGSPVRNGLMTALYKRFYERITYPLGFHLRLEGKHVLAISSVGLATGAAASRRSLGLQGMGPRLSGFIFRAVGIPTKVRPEDMRERFERAADQLLADIRTRRPRGLWQRIGAWVDRVTMVKYMFNKQPEVYTSVIAAWQAKGYMKAK